MMQEGPLRPRLFALFDLYCTNTTPEQ